ncbi:MAG: D-2-hydroxyacid dehydrogenase [Candidatus Hydrogenedentes bacterium]|nr:D-2-hydroxyacid dehydrogenase [Candidatus Hydrogenedentota bacterium]
MRIVVLDGYTLNPGDNPWDEVAALGDFTVYDRTPKDRIVERAKDADIVLTNKTPLSAQTLEQLPKLKFVAVLATGYNVVDVVAARERGIAVSNVPVYGTDSVAQFVFALVFELCRHVAEHDASVKSGDWSKSADFCYWNTPLLELVGKRMGIVGFGRIGRRVGELAHAFGMEVLAHDVQPGDAPKYSPFSWRTLDNVFAEADIVSLHCPQTDENTGFVNARLLGRMQKHAFFINTARGGLVNEADLAQALNMGAIAGAAVDVVSSEPIAPDNPLLGPRNIVITPHIAWATLAARQRLMKSTAENVAAFIQGTPINVVN